MIQRLQPLDFVLALLWATVVGFGVRSGAVRQVIMLLGAYIGAIASGQLYKPAATTMTQFGLSTGSVPQAEFFSYFLIFFITLGLIWLFSWRLYPHTRLPLKRKLDATLGGAVAATWGVLLLIHVITTARFFSVTHWPDQELTRLNVASQVQRSQLVPMLQVGFSPLWAAMTPWFPEPLQPRPRRPA